MRRLTWFEGPKAGAVPAWWRNQWRERMDQGAGASRAPAETVEQAKEIVLEAMRRGGNLNWLTHLGQLLDGYARDIRWIDSRNVERATQGRTEVEQPRGARLGEEAFAGPIQGEESRVSREDRIMRKAIETTRKNVENGLRRSRIREIVQKMGRDLADKVVDEIFGPEPK